MVVLNNVYVYSYAVKVDKITVLAVSNLPGNVTVNNISLKIELSNFTSSPIVILF